MARHNAHCLVLTADRSKIRSFKSMVKLLHTRVGVARIFDWGGAQTTNHMQ